MTRQCDDGYAPISRQRVGRMTVSNVSYEKDVYNGVARAKPKKKGAGMEWTHKKVAILGDMILDEYIDGTVTRISPEAPVPIHKAGKSWVRPGGACNAAANIQTLGGHALMIGLCGTDTTGTQLMGALNEIGVDTTYIKRYPIQTVKKTRITCKHQQLLRIDWEEPLDLELHHYDSLLTSLHQAKPDAILLSDYGKGVLAKNFIQRVIKISQELKIPCIVDPKGKDFSKYQGCSLITPNRNEAILATGGSQESSPQEMAHAIQNNHSIQDVMVTLSSEGMLLLQQDGSCYQQKPKAREVFDVSGAGDTVAAVMSLAMAAKMPLKSGMEYANLAAGLAVEKWGTQCVYLNELKDFKSHKSHHKIYNDLDLLQSHLETRKQSGQSIVMTNGCFDIMHAGHVQYLEEASTRGNHLVVAVNSDASIKELKGEARPITPLRQRMEMLAGLACVGSVIAFNESTPTTLLKTLEPDCLVKGGDYQPSEVVGSEVVKAYGGTVEVLGLVPEISTTHMIQKITESISNKFY